MINARKYAEIASLNARKEADQRRSVRISNLQEIDEKLQNAYRQMKVSKRKLRSRLDRSNPNIPTISKDDFRECMDQILKGQISIEEIQDSIKIRRDLLSESERNRLDLALHYPARYFHDVFEVFEKGKITQENDKFFLNDKKGPLQDFLISSLEDEKIKATRSIINDENNTPQERYAALKEIEEIDFRYGRTAIASMRFASSELKSLIDAELASVDSESNLISHSLKKDHILINKN